MQDNQKLKKAEFFLSKFFFCHLVVFFCLSCSKSPLFKAEQLWKALPVQHQGRVKPFDTFSKEVLREVYGKERYKKRSAVEVVLSWFIISDFWEDVEFMQVEKELRKKLSLSLKTKRFSPSALKKNSKLALQFAELRSLKQQEKPLDSYFKKLEKLQSRIFIYEAVKAGILIRLQPQKDNKAWLSLPEMTNPVKKQFTTLLSKYVRLISNNIFTSAKDSYSPGKKTNSGYSNQKDANLQDQALNLNEQNASLQNQDLFESFKSEVVKFQDMLFQNKKRWSKIYVEVFYNNFQAFQKAWIFYLLFLLAWIFVSLFKQRDFFKWLFPLLALGFASHSLGMFLRSYIMSRPPVSNMYETVIWVPWVALIAGFVFYLKGNKWPLIASVLLAFFCLLLSHLAPGVLDGSLQPLEAVLRSSFWLITHVLTITISYSFFFLAFVLGDMVLISYLVNKSDPLSFIYKMHNPIYRSIQWGVVFLAGGTILGAIWADYSWGRFWAWDPKESWALVSLLAYLALLHGKLIGWIRPFGLALGAVLMFFSVIMAWYGVNFVLGAGLHSYGFGSGGLEYVLSFLLLHILLCLLVCFKKYSFSLKSLFS